MSRAGWGCRCPHTTELANELRAAAVFPVTAPVLPWQALSQLMQPACCKVELGGGGEKVGTSPTTLNGEVSQLPAAKAAGYSLPLLLSRLCLARWRHNCVSLGGVSLPQ